MKRSFGNKNLLLALAILFMFVFPFLVGQSSYYMTLFVMVCVFMISSMSLNLLVGYGGQISVGNAGFLAVGGYVVALFVYYFDWPIWLVLPLAGLITGFIGLVIGLPAVRLSGHFLAVATLGFGLSIPQIALNWDSVTKGFTGISVKRPDFLASDMSLFYLIVILTVFITWMLTNIVKSGIGRAFIAIRDSEVAAQATGINVSLYKTMMFVLSAFFTGIAGGIYAYWIGYVSPSDFSIVTSMLLLAMVVVGGLASIPGAIIGAILFTVLPHFTDAYIGITNIVIGIAVVIVIYFRPDGLVSLVNLLKKKKKADVEQSVFEGGASDNANV